VNHRASIRFWQCYDALPEAIRRSADGAFELLKQNPRHPSLHLKKIGAFWSARIGLYHRALAVENGSDLIWFWIGTHADYDKLIHNK